MTPPDLLPSFSPASRDRPAATRAVKDLVRKAFATSPDASVFVAEISCGEIDCPDTETLIALHLDGKRIEFRFAKPVAEITGADIARIADEHAEARR